MGTNILEKIKSWLIIGLFAVCFIGFMVSYYRYNNLNERYETAIREQNNYRLVIDSLIDANSYNQKTIESLNEEILVLNNNISKLNTEKMRLNNKLKDLQFVVSNNISVATETLKKNLENEKF